MTANNVEPRQISYASLTIPNRMASQAFEVVTILAAKHRRDLESISIDTAELSAERSHRLSDIPSIIEI
jgi:hypothetical protein